MGQICVSNKKSTAEIQPRYGLTHRICPCNRTICAEDRAVEEKLNQILRITPGITSKYAQEK